jgi:acyl-CoA thioester hydrolase
MTPWTETYRGIVSPWECDMTEHFTIAYYFDRLADATALLGRALGLTDLARGESRPARLDVRFVRELRAGASFHILSGPLAADGEGLSLAHRVVDSASGESVTWVEEASCLAPLAPQLRERVSRRLVAWEGPPIEPRPEPKTFDGFRTTARDRVKAGEVDESGGLTRAGFVHRFTAALVQALAGLGITAEYMAERRRAYSTFELKLAIARVPRLGDALLVESGILYLGGSSMRFLHRMSDAGSGEELARLSQFGVQLDLDSRRPAPVPQEFRAKAAELLVPVEA